MLQSSCVVLVAFLSVIYAEERPIIALEDGLVRGTYKTSYHGRQFVAFEGIPFAQPPIQKLRFKDPQPVTPWTGILDATSSYTCVQLGFQDANDIVNLSGLQVESVIGQEDCLYLNVYVPTEKINSNDKLDVIVHIHGGAFMLGNAVAMAGPGKLMDRNVVFVTFNYRLGPLGFFSNGDAILPGNYGLKDQTFALKWIQKNIEKFGGNHNSVTITGGSAGGASVHLHYFSPLSKGLFHRGFAESGVALNPWGVKEDPWVHGKILAKEVGCYSESVKVIRQCLQERPAIQLQNAVKKLYKGMLLPLAPFAPAIEPSASTSFLTSDPYLQLVSKSVTDVPFMATMATEEGLLPTMFYYQELGQVNDKLELLFPLMLEYYGYSEAIQNEITAKVKEYYFNNEPITYENFDNLTKVCSQRLFHIGSEKSVKLQASASTSDVYFVMMGYGGESAFPGIEHLGVGHAADLKFYYDLEYFLSKKPLNEEEVKMKDILLDMLVSYAKTGKPLINSVDFEPVPRDGKMKYLLVKGPDNIQMKTTDTLGGLEFWNSLGLKEDENLYA